MTAKVIELNHDKRTKLRSNSAALRKENDRLRAKEVSMSMLLHAIVRRHGAQTFSLQGVETCDPAGVDVRIDYDTGRVVICLTDPEEA